MPRRRPVDLFALRNGQLELPLVSASLYQLIYDAIIKCSALSPSLSLPISPGEAQLLCLWCPPFASAVTAAAGVAVDAALAFHNRCQFQGKCTQLWATDRPRLGLPLRLRLRCLLLLGSVSHDLVSCARVSPQVRVKLSRSGDGDGVGYGATASAAEAAAATAAEAEAAAAAAAHVSLLSLPGCQLSLNIHSNATANGRGSGRDGGRGAATLGYVFSRSQRQHQLHTHTLTYMLALIFTSIFTSSLPSTQKRQFCWLNAFERVARERSSSPASSLVASLVSSSSQSQFQFPSPSSSSCSGACMAHKYLLPT